jgi:hypothetical protein
VAEGPLETAPQPPASVDAAVDEAETFAPITFPGEPAELVRSWVAQLGRDRTPEGSGLLGDLLGAEEGTTSPTPPTPEGVSPRRTDDDRVGGRDLKPGAGLHEGERFRGVKGTRRLLWKWAMKKATLCPCRRLSFSEVFP